MAIYKQEKDDQGNPTGKWYTPTDETGLGERLKEINQMLDFKRDAKSDLNASVARLTSEIDALVLEKNEIKTILNIT